MALPLEGTVAVDPRRPQQLPSMPPCAQRALAIWPRLDVVRLRRAKDDPERIARLVGRRTGIPHEQILAMLAPATRS